MVQSLLTTKNQTTIPREVREALGLGPHSRIIYEIQNGQVLIKPAHQGVDELFGSLKSTVPPAKTKAQRASAVEKLAHRHRVK
ncbi:type II toxin-antitoxin system PrlF family antitoxin [Oscillatoria amoena NRMC-F 0135]|nr:type II toxin-antitoxin system PrlF family antitoxin [Oscillatoria amoena NRMC-F 0135]